MSHLKLHGFADQFMQQARPVSEADIHSVVGTATTVQSHVPHILRMIENDKDAPEELRELLSKSGVFDKFTESFKDPNIDVVSYDVACKECRDWVNLNCRAVNGGASLEYVRVALDTFCQFIKDSGIDLYRVRCSDPTCTELHIVMPMRVPRGWMSVDGMGEELFADVNTDEDGNTLVVLDCEPLLLGFTGLATLYGEHVAEMNKQFPIRGDVNSFNLGHLNVEDFTRARFTMSVFLFQEWSNLMRLMHFKNSDGAWVKR